MNKATLALLALLGSSPPFLRRGLVVRRMASIRPVQRSI